MSQLASKLDSFYRFALAAYLFVLVLAMYWGTDDPTIHIKELITAWAAGLLAGSYVLVSWITGRPLRRPAIFAEVILCLLAFFAIGTAFSDYFRYSLLETGQFFGLFALYWLASQIYRTPEQVLRLFTVFCAAVFVAGLYAVAQKAGLDPFPWEDRTSDTYTNLPATFGNPNYAAHAIILALIMIACLLRSGAAWTAWVLAPVLLFHLASTGQRAGWIALAGAAALVAISWVFLRTSRRPVLGVTASLLIFAALGFAAAGSAMYMTHLRTGQIFPLDLSLLLRYQSYVSATSMLFESPLVGHGPGVYALAYAPHWTPFEQAWFAQELRVNEHVHNDLLELAIDGGIAAAGLYLTLIVLGAGFGLLMAAQGPSPAHRRLGYAFAAFFAAFAIDGLFGFNLRVPVTAALFFIVMGLLDGLWRENRQNAASLPPGWSRALRAAFAVLLALATWQETRRFVSEYHFNAGEDARRAGDLDAAMRAFESAARHAGWNWRIPGHMGLVELDRQRPDVALRHFETALALNPHAFLNHLPAGRANLMLAQAAAREEGGIPVAEDRLEAARENARAILETAPGLPSAHGLLGRVESIAAILKRDQPDRADEAGAHWAAARDHFQEAIDGGARNPAEIYRMIMQVESARGDLDAAGQALAAAIQIAPEDKSSWTAFYEFAKQHDRFDQYRGVLYRQIDMLLAITDPSAADRAELAEAWSWLAAVLDEGIGDAEGAADALARAVEAGPMRPDLWNRFATFTEKHGRRLAFDETLLASADALAERAETPLPQVEAVAMVLRDPAGQIDPASRVLLAALRAQPPQTPPLALMLAYGWAASRVQEAYDQLQADGGAPCESALNLGIVAATLGGRDLAATLFERAHGCLEGEQRAACAVHWGDLLLRGGDAEGALERLREAEAEFPDHLEVQWSIARALAAAGNAEEARATFQRLLADPDLGPDAAGQIQRELQALGGAGAATEGGTR